MLLLAGIGEYSTCPNNFGCHSFMPATEWSKLLGPGTIGFMPYDLSIPKNLYCAPLKLFDYWERGMPVVGTPIVYLRDYPNAVQQALEETRG